MPKTDDVHRYARHAKLYGTELVFETARAEGWPIGRLAALSLALQQIDPKWRIPIVNGKATHHEWLEAAEAQLGDDDSDAAIEQALLATFGSRVNRRVAFARELIAAGVQPDRACQAAMISRRTLRRAELPRAELPAGSPPPGEWGENRLFPRGEAWTNRPPLTQPPPPADLTTPGPQNGAGAVLGDELIRGQLDLFEAAPAS
jgi:hypothetical protein